MTHAQRIASPDEAFYQFLDVRRRTQAIAAPLCTEDQVIQSMPDASPTKWHLAHTSWFLERFILADYSPAYTPVNEHYFYLFNSYYNTVGPMHKRAQRGLLSRPTVRDIEDYRAAIDERMMDWLDRTSLDPALTFLLTLGLHHEQQHQELILTDIKHALSLNPMLPAYAGLPVPATRPAARSSRAGFVRVDEQNIEIGHTGDGFAFDNETPRHTVRLHAHELARAPVTNAEYRDFVRDGGYQQSDHWLSEAWSVLQERRWQHPLYWQRDLDSEYTLAGVRALDPDAPVCHLSLYEADAYARWAGARLPTEAELEFALMAGPCGAQEPAQKSGPTSTQEPARTSGPTSVHETARTSGHASTPTTPAGNFYESGWLHPVANTDHTSPFAQLYGDVWEWTSSSYTPYPGFKPLAGSLGEYNGKFMCSQHVLRGGSCVSPLSHLRATYRNFFYPDARWQFSGVRLARDI